ncbi:Uncharacterised protein [Shigella sonnei]|nr:Uncharacterised protein [Shigella sonnei]CSS24123.1 Uncharacterised protein [Shigella sonnei]
MIQRIVSIHTVGTHANNRFKQVLFGIGVDIKLPLAAVLFFVVQFADQRVHPAGNGLLIREVGFRQRRLIDKLFQHCFRITTLHAVDHFLRRVVLRHQFL